MSMAEARFAAAQKKAKQALTEVEKARQEVAKRTANLRTLRLARDAADKQAADDAAAAKPATKKKPQAKKTPTRPPRIY
jgi:hypothetical protein